ncbi:MAG: DUF2442 domain-containing protein [Okeania sp. SIO2D1]|nr:DUF2442 domain-containing protein [Okeania sp. SIO2D1]
MSISTPQADERVKNVQIQEDTFSVKLMDGRNYCSFSLVSSSEITPEQLQAWEICGGGYGIHWEEIDEDISTEGLLRGAPAPGSQLRSLV